MELLKFFEYKHSPEKLHPILAVYYEAAHKLNKELCSGPEKTIALRKLLESRDSAVRAYR